LNFVHFEPPSSRGSAFPSLVDREIVIVIPAFSRTTLRHAFNDAKKILIALNYFRILRPTNIYFDVLLSYSSSIQDEKR